MPEREQEPFSNPLPPHGLDLRLEAEGHAHNRLTNEDFRKLLMTPRAPPSAAPPTEKPEVHSTRSEVHDDRADKRKKKKKFYASLKKLEEDKLAELASKYRDRARERREGANPDYQNEDPISSTAGYRAVAPDAKSGLDAAERRRQMIQESKFLGGDMEHTHLVKGLDYALLQKVRSEINFKEKEDEELENIISKNPDKETEEELDFKTKMGKRVYRLVFRHRFPERNDNFLPGRMAYVIDLEDEYAESDIPTTLVRSKADCPNFESQTTLTTNDIVINKLTQILSYLRQGVHNKKGKKKGAAGNKGEKEDDRTMAKLGDDSIYGEIGEYQGPTIERKSKDRNRDKDRDRDRERDRDRDHEKKRSSYFEKPANEDERERSERQKVEHSKEDRHSKWTSAENSSYPSESGDRDRSSRTEDKRLRAKLTSKLERDMPESYAECYPGAPENDDAMADSDDEADYTKMDMGNKKGPVGRWDFDTQEEYSDYMSHKEALPKAAFQYGVKMADGRKTRRTIPGKKDEKAKLDRELQKINQIISKRKVAEAEAIVTASSGGSEVEYKRSRH